MIQQSLPVMVFAKEPVTVTYRGGTDTAHAPPIDHYIMVSSCKEMHFDDEQAYTHFRSST